MSVPGRFLVAETFKHHRPEYVREVAARYGFACRTPQGTAASEIWVKPDGGGGFWIIRLDSMGHDTKWFHGARPHYHKNWVPSQALLDQYLCRYTPTHSPVSKWNRQTSRRFLLLPHRSRQEN